jgi:glycosyltransferase involved in cell wall biosynthesis
VHAAPPGVDAAPLTERSATGGRLLCVAAVAAHKGHDLLIGALSGLADPLWELHCVGSLDRDPEYVARVRALAEDAGIADRVRWSGARTGADLDAAYAGADLLILPSRGETYGMVVTEALARGVPVVTTDAGGLPESLGSVAAGRRPGLLVAPEDPVALAAALRRWLTEPALRDELRRCALVRRSTLTGWSVTTRLVAKALSTVAAKVSA